MAILLDPKGQSITIKIKKIKEENQVNQSDEKEKEIDFYRPEETETNDNLPINYSSVYGPHIKQLQGVGEWVKGIKLFQSQRLLIAWKKEILTGGQEEPSRVSKVKCTRDQIIFYALDTYGQYQQGEVWSRYYDASIKEDFITDLLVFKEQKFFITAHNFGDIHLRKLVELQTSMPPDVDEADKGIE
jgi:hypothetical protein